MKKLYCNGKKDFCTHYNGKDLPDCHIVECKHFDNTGCKETEDVFTNYDHIRNMSVDEMAEFLSEIAGSWICKNERLTVCDECKEDFINCTKDFATCMYKQYLLQEFKVPTLKEGAE